MGNRQYSQVKEVSKSPAPVRTTNYGTNTTTNYTTVTSSKRVEPVNRTSYTRVIET